MLKLRVRFTRMSFGNLHRWAWLSLSLPMALAACGPPASSPPPSIAPPPATLPSAPALPEQKDASPLPVSPTSLPSAVRPSVKLAPLNPALETWKHTAAERIHQASAAELFSGRPQQLLRAIIVIQISVDARGRIAQSRIVRSPGAPALEAKALHALRRAAPLPAPPPELLKRGHLVYSETWLFNSDGRFQLRTLALPQE